MLVFWVINVNGFVITHCKAPLFAIPFVYYFFVFPLVWLLMTLLVNLVLLNSSVSVLLFWNQSSKGIQLTTTNSMTFCPVLLNHQWLMDSYVMRMRHSLWWVETLLGHYHHHHINIIPLLVQFHTVNDQLHLFNLRGALHCFCFARKYSILRFCFDWC